MAEAVGAGMAGAEEDRGRKGVAASAEPVEGDEVG